MDYGPGCVLGLFLREDKGDGLARHIFRSDAHDEFFAIGTGLKDFLRPKFIAAMFADKEILRGFAGDLSAADRAGEQDLHHAGQGLGSGGIP